MNLYKDKTWFSVTPIIPNIIVIAIALGIYYFLISHYLFPEWLNVIFWVVKIIIAFEIIRASARSLVAPLLALSIGLLLLFAIQVYYLSAISSSDAWQLIMMSGVGFIITVLVKLN